MATHTNIQYINTYNTYIEYIYHVPTLNYLLNGHSKSLATRQQHTNLALPDTNTYKN